MSRSAASSPPSRHHALRQHARGLDERHVVHQVERLQRRVGARLADGAGLAAGASKVIIEGGGDGALPERVEAAAVEVRRRGPAL